MQLGGGKPPAGQQGEMTVPRSAIVGFSIGSLGTGIYSVAPSALLLYFMTDILGIAAGLAALAVAVPKLWDVITDPVMGWLSDRTRSRWGRRRPYLLLGAILMSVSFVFLFSVPESLSVNGRFWYVLLIFILSATAYTVFAVPYISMPNEMSSDPHERTVIMSYRMVCAMVGLLIGSALAPMLVGWFGGGRQGYAAMSYIVGGFCAATMLTAFFATKSIQVGEEPKLSSSADGSFWAGLKNKWFLLLIFSYVLQLAGIATFLSSAPFFVVYILQLDAAETGTVFLFLIATALFSIPLWAWRSGKIGKLACYKQAAIAYAVINMCLLLVSGPETLHVLYGLTILSGIPFGCIMMMPFSMLTDTVQYDTLTTGLKREGTFTGLWTAGEKMGTAIGPMIAGTILSVFGFQEALGGTIAAQSAAALWGIKASFVIMPSLLVLLSLLPLSMYKLDEAQLVTSIRRA